MSTNEVVAFANSAKPTHAVIQVATEANPEAESNKGFCSAKLAEMPAEALLDEEALAGVLEVSARTIRRMVGRGQLPPGVKLGARRIWMAGRVIQHLESEANRLATAARRQSVHRSASEG